jgi:uncharacterized phage protein gp47/JayE
MAQITNKGYSLKTVNEWFDEERQLYIDIDPLWNLEPSTPDGLKIAHDSEIFGALDEVLQQSYNARDPNKAVDYDLDVLSALTGTSRSEGSASSVAVTMTGTPTTTVVPAGTRFQSATTGTTWTLDQTWTLDSTGQATGQATCTIVGRTEADANTITKILDTVSGLTSVNNLTPATPGEDVESNASLRVKRATAVGRPGNNQVDSMIGELFAASGVRRVKIYENDTNVTDSKGLPPHSIAPVVDGGTDEDVALAVYIKKSTGVQLYQIGTPVSIDVASPKYPTNIHTVRFSRPVYVDMIVAITLKNDGTLPSQTALEPPCSITQSKLYALASVSISRRQSLKST